jgi:hypothetical protein
MINNVCHSIGQATVHNSDNEDVTKNLLGSFIALLLVIVIILFIGKILWNDVLTSLIPGIKPAKNIWQILGLYILISLLFGR